VASCAPGIRAADAHPLPLRSAAHRLRCLFVPQRPSRREPLVHRRPASPPASSPRARRAARADCPRRECPLPVNLIVGLEERMIERLRPRARRLPRRPCSLAAAAATRSPARCARSSHGGGRPSGGGGRRRAGRGRRRRLLLRATRCGGRPRRRPPSCSRRSSCGWPRGTSEAAIRSGERGHRLARRDESRRCFLLREGAAARRSAGIATRRALRSARRVAASRGADDGAPARALHRGRRCAGGRGRGGAGVAHGRAAVAAGARRCRAGNPRPAPTSPRRSRRSAQARPEPVRARRSAVCRPGQIDAGPAPIHLSTRTTSGTSETVLEQLGPVSCPPAPGRSPGCASPRPLTASPLPVAHSVSTGCRPDRFPRSPFSSGPKFPAVSLLFSLVVAYP